MLDDGKRLSPRQDLRSNEPEPTPGGRLQAIFAGSAGNLVEWYDFYAYTAFSLYFAGAFFPGSDPIVQQLDAALLFALGFLVRPVGGWLFGHVADNLGRSRALALSVLLMCIGSLLVAITPTYNSVGRTAPLLLALARTLQGLSLGGEYAASATYISEQAPREHRGFYSSFLYATMLGGQVLALLVLIVLQALLSSEDLARWGWRIPFALGGILAVSALQMRKSLHETADFQNVRQASERESHVRSLLRHPKEMLLAAGLTMGGTAAFYTYTTYMQKFLKLTVGLSDRATSSVTFISLAIAIVLQPAYGALSDRIGRKPLLVWFGVMGTLWTIPMLNTLTRARTPGTALVILVCAWVILSGYTSVNAVVKTELFPARVRATGVGLAHSITVSIFGGTTEPIALWCKSIGHEEWFYRYLTAVIAASLVIYVGMRDTRTESAFEPKHGPFTG